MVDFLFALTERFRYLLQFRNYEAKTRNVYSSALSQGGQPLCTQILHGQGSPPINHSWQQKTRDTGLPDFAFPHFDTIPECDGQTDGLAVAYTALAKLALRRAVIKWKAAAATLHTTHHIC